MSYKSKSGQDIPLCYKLNDTQLIHGKCLLCEYGCLKCNCSPLINLTITCRNLCKIPCELIQKCELTLQGLLTGPTCDIGPEIGCKSVGVEITCGQKALENSIGVWHFGNTMFPEFLPSMLFPCCCFGVFFPLPIGEDNTVSGENWSTGTPTVTKLKLCKCLFGQCCSASLCCKPHAACSASICGLCMEPAFNGALPFWFCSEFQLPYIKITTNGSVHP